jgi:hypothetical protein
MTALIGLSAVVDLVLQFLLPSDFLHLASTSHAIYKRLFTSETNVTLHESLSQLQQQQQTDSADDAEDSNENGDDDENEISFKSRTNKD